MDRRVFIYLAFAAVSVTLVGSLVAPYLEIDAIILVIFAFAIGVRSLRKVEGDEAHIPEKSINVNSRITRYGRLARSKSKNLQKLANNPFEENLFSDAKWRTLSIEGLDQIKDMTTETTREEELRGQER